MERFKVLEKETKTKAYSKEGLSQSLKKKKDPKLDPKFETYQWIEKNIKELKKQLEGFAQKAVPTKGKKGKAKGKNEGTSKWYVFHTTPYAICPSCSVFVHLPSIYLICRQSPALTLIAIRCIMQPIT